MAENSFYGGRPGFSCIIAQSFESVDEMVKNFSKGPSYSGVHFNEYVLINSTDNNDPENGRIYRRGYDYTNNLGGAIYIGTIKGPAGQSPYFEMTTVAKIDEMHEAGGDDDRYATGAYKPTADLVPGKSGEEFNDEIKWASYSMMDPNGVDTTAYIGFIFPYLVEQFTAARVSAYEETELITRKDNGEHPFYQEWEIKIPKGVKGDALKDFKVVEANMDIEPYDDQENDVAGHRKVLVYDYYNYDDSEAGTKSTLYLGDYNMIKDISIDDQGTVTIAYTHDDTDTFDKLFKWITDVKLDTETGRFTVTYNQNDAEGSPTTYAVDLKWIKDLTVGADGTITLQYSNGSPQTLESKIKWIKQIVMAEDGTVTVTYNDDSTEVFDKEIQWINSIELADDGTFTVTYNNGTDNYVKKLVWVTDITLDETGTIIIKYNNGETVEHANYLKSIQGIEVTPEGDIVITYNTQETAKFNGYLKTITGVTLSEEGTLTITYNTGDSTEFEGCLKTITNVAIDDDGTITVNYNTGNPEVYEQYLKSIKNIYIQTESAEGAGEGTGDQQIHIEYNTGTEAIIGKPLNYIIDTVVNEYYHLLIYYSDPQKRAGIENPVEYNGKSGWLDLGSIKDEDGILIGLNFEPSDVGADVDQIITELNETYPGGLTQEGMRGKIVTVGSGSADNKDFYGYDYDAGSWYYLGSFDVKMDSLIIVGKADDPEIDDKKKALTPGGIWFVVKGDEGVG